MLGSRSRLIKINQKTCTVHPILPLTNLISMLQCNSSTRAGNRYHNDGKYNGRYYRHAELDYSITGSSSADSTELKVGIRI